MAKKQVKTPVERSARSSATGDMLNSVQQKNAGAYNPGSASQAASEQAARNLASAQAPYDRDPQSTSGTRGATVDHVSGPVPGPSKGLPTPPDMWGVDGKQ